MTPRSDPHTEAIRRAFADNDYRTLAALVGDLNARAVAAEARVTQLEEALGELENVARNASTWAPRRQRIYLAGLIDAALGVVADGGGGCPDCDGAGWIALPDEDGEPEQHECERCHGGRDE